MKPHAHTDPPHLSTPARRWAQQRFMAKGQIASMRTLLSRLKTSDVLTADEKMQARIASVYLGRLYELWDYQNEVSKKAFLKKEETK